MIAQKNTSMIEFIGNVKVTRADSVVFADSIKIYFMDDNKNKDAQNNIKKIISTGNVKYTAGERKAFADKAVYTTQDGILVLTGKSPKLITGSSFVTGKKITLFRNQDKVLVESDGTKRVEALFNPEDNITEKQ
jgi:lipopolysaccharide export system protein LptA